MNPFPIIMMIVSTAINYANRPKIQPPKPAAFEQFEFPVAEEGTRQYVIFGDVWIKDWIVLSYGNFRTSPGTTNPIEAWFSPSEELGLGLSQYDPFQPEEPNNNLPALLDGDTWIGN